jgi:Tfp pilus assembly protein PilP
MPRSLFITAAAALPLVLSACATPQEQCISRVTADLRNTRAALVTAQENVARGYALHREREPYTVYETCFRTNANGARIAFPCP